MKKWLQTYKSLLIIIGIIVLCALAVSVPTGDTQAFMRAVMAGFFLVFSGFKLINIGGFVNGYKMYDLIAKRVDCWAYIYPFIELGLGLLYLTNRFQWQANVATIAVMGSAAVGVIEQLRKKQKITCACLGTVINVPLTYITLAEDLVMVVMAAWMLVIMY